MFLPPIFKLATETAAGKSAESVQLRCLPKLAILKMAVVSCASTLQAASGETQTENSNNYLPLQ